LVEIDKELIFRQSNCFTFTNCVSHRAGCIFSFERDINFIKQPCCCKSVITDVYYILSVAKSAIWLQIFLPIDTIL